MRLHEFILANREPILTEWVEFARTCTPASGTMNLDALRDHADGMLVAIAKDLATPQTARAQGEKGKGLGPDPSPEATSAAEEHGVGRAESGFSVEQMVAEYRALRASVIRLWTKANGQLAGPEIADLTRFNEAIDQALAESVSRYNSEVEQAKEIFLATLGHDLRTPLGAIYTSAAFMLDTHELTEPHLSLTKRIAASAKRTVGMVGDLLDFTRGRLGGGIPITRAEVNLGKIVHDAVDEVVAAHPDATVKVETRGDVRGRWDPGRISQAVANILGNAVQHGTAGAPITVCVRGDTDEVAISVHNLGAAIRPEQLDGIFNPMKSRGAERGKAPARAGPTGSLGLGLYIVERIVTAHGGRTDVESTDQAGTTFTIHLPRRDPASR